MSFDQTLRRETSARLDGREDYAAIFDALRLRLQPLGVTEFTYVQVPHIGAFDFQTPIKAHRVVSEDADVNIVNLDGEAIRRFTTSVGTDPEGNGYYGALPVEIRTDNEGKSSLNLSKSYSSDHFCCLTLAPQYNLGCFLLSINSIENSDFFSKSYRFCNEAHQSLSRTQSALNRQKHARSRLTVREKSVMKLVVQGKSTPSIAKLLNISPHTVSKYIQHIILKLDVENRISAALRVVAEDLIEY